MAEYIEREATLEECDWYASEFCECEYAIMPLKGALENLPAADVRPVARGRWKLDSDPGEPWRYVCNICGEKTKDTVMGKPRANFCPNCGAMMEES